MDYNGWITAVCDLLVATTTDPNFTAILPSALNYAENRIYQDLDPIDTQVTATTALTPGVSTFQLPSTNGTFYVVNNINIVGSGPLTRTSIDSIYALYPTVTGSTAPSFYAMRTQTTALVGPWPDSAYTVEVVGTVRPPQLSSSSPTTTILTVFYPDLFVAASMVYFMGWQRDFGAQTSDPSASQSWEQQYQIRLQAARIEEARKKAQAEGWSSAQPSPIATPPRT